MSSVVRDLAVRVWLALLMALPVVLAACNNKGSGPGY